MMVGTKSGWGEGLEAMGRQVWEAWGDALRKAASASKDAGPAWQQAPGGWPGWDAAQSSGIDDVMGRFDGLARYWFGLMQDVAGEFADRDNSPEEIVAAWRRALGATETKPYPDLFSSLFGKNAAALDGLSEQWISWLESLLGPLDEWAKTPALGPVREHQQRWKGLLKSQQAVREATERYQRLMEEASRDAYALFEEKLHARASSDTPLDSARALFDEWIDAAEDAYAKVALSEEFREVYGILADAQMRLRAGIQSEVEQLGGMLGLPTRMEVDAAHRKIAELERLLRNMMRASGVAAEAGEHQNQKAKPKAAAASQAKKKKTRSVTTKKSAAKKTPAKSATTKRATNRPPSASAAKSASTGAKAKPGTRTVAKKAIRRAPSSSSKRGA